jgi:AcrR family transcriptional regulator
MGTKERRARSKENPPEEILEVARSLFVKEGYNNVSIRKIADKIEYAPGTIYLYFKDKADILRTICDETFGRLRSAGCIAGSARLPRIRVRRLTNSVGPGGPMCNLLLTIHLNIYLYL